MHPKFLFALCAAWVLPSAALQAQTYSYTLVDLGTGSGLVNTAATALNSYGQVVGYSAYSGQAFEYSGGAFYSLPSFGDYFPLPSFADNTPSGINASGVIVGSSSVSSSSYGYVYANGSWTPVGAFLGNGAWSVASAVNASGTVVGTEFVISQNATNAFIYANGSKTDLSFAPNYESHAFAINSSGQVVGVADSPTFIQHAFLYSNGSMTDLGTLAGGGGGSYAYGINDSGQIVGYSDTATLAEHAFLYSNGTMTDLGVRPSKIYSVALGINNSGVAVGSDSPGQVIPEPGTHALLFMNGLVIDLNTVTDLANTGFTSLDSAAAINDSGVIVGNGTFSDNSTHAFMLLPLGYTLPPAPTPGPTPTPGPPPTPTPTPTGGPTPTPAPTPAPTPTPTPSPTPTPTPARSSHLVNLSLRANAASASQTLIAGFVVSGSGSKNVLIRGDGPVLAAFGVTDSLPDPVLTLYDPEGDPVSSNSGWSGSANLVNAFSRVGAFSLPMGSKDAALLSTLATGAYTAQITSSSGDFGVALVEIYDADTGTPTARFINLSARCQVGTGAEALIAGFVVSGTTTTTVLIRGNGPVLGQFGVSGTLAAPQLTLFDGDQKAIATNVGWSNPSTPGSSAVAATLSPATSQIFSKVGAFAWSAGSADCAMVATLPPGAYTAEVSGVNKTTGVALIEVYEVP